MTINPPENTRDKIAELEAKVAEADALAEMKSNFLATMSHEIRTPMQTIYGILELIDEEKPDAKISNLVDIARKASSGLLEILDDVLDLAKVDAGKMELDVYEVPVRLLVRGLLEALAVKVHSAGIELIDDIEQDVPFVVIGDPKRLRQIIMNLCGNALKFTDKGSVTVRVTTNTKVLKTPKIGIGLRFEIIDTGIGMSEEARSKLFQNFSQADSSTSRKYGGTGLGLSISRQIVELMGGTIHVQSRLNQGSTFTVVLELPRAEQRLEAIPVADMASLRVLGVDDNAVNLEILKELLAGWRIDCELTSSCDECMDLLRQGVRSRRPFHVAILDFHMPDMDGMELARRIKDDPELVATK
ncbi:MAG: ATP-binding protein, partial [Alphaproteobacteria bacterium]